MKKWWIWLLVVAVAGGGVGLLLGWPATEVMVKTTRLEPRRVEQTVRCSGVVEAGESTPVLLPISCVIQEVCVRAGQQVKKGDLLAVVDKEATRGLLEDQPAALMVLAALEPRITAPATGIVVAVKAKTGKTLEPDTPCVALAPRSGLQVRIVIREKDLPVLESGMAVHVTGDGFARDRYAGTLDVISSTADNSGNGAAVEGVVVLQPGQADESLRLGLTAKASVVTAVSDEALVVPFEAVVSENDGTEYIYLLENGVAHRREILAAATLGDGLLVEDDRLSGAVVILQPEKVTGDGMPVLAREEAQA